MTMNYIEIIKRSPYYYQVDGSILEENIPIVYNNIKNFWKSWKECLPPYCVKEKIFLEIVQMEHENTLSFIETIQYFKSSLDNNLVGFISQHEKIVNEIYRLEKHHMIIPTLEYWKIIKKNLLSCSTFTEMVPYFFLRISLEFYNNDWTATTTCFRNLLMGKILLDFQTNSCFVQGTRIWTTQGIQPIETIQSGDYVCTHNGRFSKVLKLFKNNCRQRTLYHVYSAQGHIAIATEDHPFLVYSHEYNQIVWKKVCDLSSNDYFMKATLNHQSYLGVSTFLEAYPELNKFIQKFPRIIGIAMSRVSNNNGVINITQEEIINCLKTIGMDPTQDLSIYQDILILLTDIKIRIQIWKWVLQTNQYFFVKGWMEAFQTKTFFSTYEEAEIVSMVLNLYHYNVQIKKSCFLFHNQQKWCLFFTKKSCFHNNNCCWFKKNVLFFQDKVFVRFIGKLKCSKKIHQDNPHVYTLHVEKDYSYTVNGYIVKNCMGLLPNTMIMTQQGLVPISHLKKGDYILDKNLCNVEIQNVVKYSYKGPVVSINDCVHTINTPIYKTDNTFCLTQDITNTKEIYSPSISYYYNANIDRSFTIYHLNFLLRYLCDWTIQEEHDQYKWEISKADKLWILPIIFKCFYPFQYLIDQQDNMISIHKNEFDIFIAQCLEKLLFISITRLVYFSSYLDRRYSQQRDGKNDWCHTIQCFIKQEKIIKQYEYVGVIYDLEILSDGYCTTQSVIRKQVKTNIHFKQDDNISSYFFIPNSFFQKITTCDETYSIWQNILKSQRTCGKPSVICIDSPKNECVSGDTRILTSNGIVQIASKKDEMVPVWNGKQFINVLVQQTGNEKKFLKIYFSNGMCLTCTPYHNFFLKSSFHEQPQKKNASELICGHEIYPFQLPSISSIDIIPSSILMTIEWIAKRCVFVEENVVLFEKDIESLRDILLDLQYCGLKSSISYNSFRNEYELRINKSRWNLLNYRHLNKNSSYIHGDMVDDLVIVKIEESPSCQPSYCFHEPLLGMAVFEGVCTGQCENLSNNFSYKACIDLTKFLTENPLKQTLNKHHVQVYTTTDCYLSQLIQLEYNSFEKKDIVMFQEEWEVKRHVHALSNVPAIFLDNIYIGDFMDFWNTYLCPMIDLENLFQTIYSLCFHLDDWMDHQQEKDQIVSTRPLVFEIYGFPNVLVEMRLSIDDPKTRHLNSLVCETIYYATLKASNDLSIQKGSKRIIQPFHSDEKWGALHQSIQQHGIRNSIFLNIFEKEEMNIVSCFYKNLKKDLTVFLPPVTLTPSLWDQIYSSNSIQHLDIPNSFKKIYQNQYEVQPQTSHLALMLNRRKYNVMNDTFHLYMDGKNMDQETLSHLQLTAWKEGFYEIQIHTKIK